MKKKLNTNGRDTLVIIPAYNEALNIEFVLSELYNDLQMIDILVINDCSKDDTEIILKKLKVNYINTPYNFGYSGVLQTGFKYAIKNGYKYVVQFDGDGQHIASEVNKLIECMAKTGCDIVIGSRFIGKNDYNHSFLRSLGTNIFKKLIKLNTGKIICDPTSGFQILNEDVIRKYASFGGYPEYPDANLIIKMLLDGYKIEEIPVKMRAREYGESMHSGFIKPAKYMVKMIYSVMLLTTSLFIKGENK